MCLIGAGKPLLDQTGSIVYSGTPDKSSGISGRFYKSGSGSCQQYKSSTQIQFTAWLLQMVHSLLTGGLCEKDSEVDQFVWPIT